jgi:hypothetical protein
MSKRKMKPHGNTIHPPDKSLLLRIADHAKLAGFIALEAVAIAFSQKPSSAAVWVASVGACIFLILLVREFSSTRGRLFTSLVAIASCLVVLAIGTWLNEPPYLPVVFKNPSEPNLLRRILIRRRMTEFNLYVAGIGFEVPHTIPPIGIGEETMVLAASRGEAGGISLSRDADQRNIVEMYSAVIFVPLIAGGQHGIVTASKTEAFSGLDTESKRRMWASSIYSTYFVCSYFNDCSRRVVDDPWIDILWEIRAELGKWRTDHALMYALEPFDIWMPREGESLDSAFGTCVLAGILTMSNDPVADGDRVKKILGRHDIKLIDNHGRREIMQIR